MKPTHILYFIALTLLLASCSKSDAPGDSGKAAGSGATAGGSQAAATVSGITGTGDADAVAALRTEILKHWLQTADGWLSEYPSHLNMAGQRTDNVNYYRQMKSLNFEIETNDVSPSDKLNGISYLGIARFENTSLRKYNDPDEMGPPKWSIWRDMSASVQVEKKNGKWDFTGTNGEVVTGDKPTAATIAALK